MDSIKTAVIGVGALGRHHLRWYSQIEGSEVVGVYDIDREKAEQYAKEAFERWARAEGLVPDAPRGEVVVFQTCYVQNNEPQIGRDTVEVLQRNGVDVACAAGLECCGMPAWETGDLDGVRRRARANLDRLLPFVEQGAKVLAINPTCSMMLRREYPELVAGEDRERADRKSVV